MTASKMDAPEKKRIGELLVENGYVTSEQVREALVIQKSNRERLANILIDLGYLSESDFLEFLVAIPGSASINLAACEIEQEILALVPSQLARRLELVPIGKLGSSLTVAMVCPLDEAGRSELEEATGLKVRPVLCSRKAVYSAFDRYYAETADSARPKESERNLSELEDTLKLRRIAKLIEEMTEIPTLPTVIQAISEIVNDPDSSASDLARVIGSDVGLSSKMLKLANSAAFGFSREIADIQHAIALLGFRQTQELALSIPIFENLIKLADFDFKSFWDHSLRCAKLSKMLSLALRNRTMDSAFVAGLLHDIGQVVFAISMRAKKEEADTLQLGTHLSGVEAEEKVLGITHAEIGYHLGEHWLLPPVLTAAIRYHHNPELQPQPQNISDTVFLANAFCETTLSEFHEMERLDDRASETLDRLQMSEVVFKKAIESFVHTKKTSEIKLF